VPVLGALFRLAKAIPIAPYKEDAATYEAAFERAAQVLRAATCWPSSPKAASRATGSCSRSRAAL
jgi:hypothetical protein